VTDVKLTTSLVGIKQVETGIANLDKGIGKLSKSVTKFGDDMTKAGKAMTTKVTLPILAMGAAVLKVAGDFEAGMNRVRALTAATGEQMIKMEKQARELGATTQFSASQAADAMGFMAQAGLNANDIMGSLPHTLNIAAAAQIDMGRAADITTNIMKGFRLETDDMGHAVDVLTATFTNSNTDLNQLAEAMKMVAPVASGFKVSMEETAAAVGLLGNAGLQGSLAGTTLRNVLIRLADPADESAALLKELGINAMTSSGQFVGFIDLIRQMEKAGANTAEILKIFAARAGPGMEVLLSQGSDALEAFTKKLENSGGTAARIAKIQMEGFNGAIKELTSALSELALAIGDTGFLDLFTTLAKDAAAFTREIAAMNPYLLRLGTIAAGVVAGIGPLLIVAGLLTKAFGMLLGIAGSLVSTFLLLGTKAIKILIGSFVLLVKAIGLVISPIGLIIAAVVAVGLAAVVVARNWDEMGKIWTAVTLNLGRFWDKFQGLFLNGLAIMVKNFRAFLGTFGKLPDFIDNALKDVEKSIKERAIANFKEWEDAAKATGEANVEALEAMDRAVDDATSGVEDLIATGVEFGNTIGDALVDGVTPAFEALQAQIRSAEVASVSMIDIWEGIPTDPIDDSVAAMERFTAASKKSMEGVAGVTQGIERLGPAWEGIGKATTSYLDDIRDVAKQTEASMGRVLLGLEDALTQFFLTGKLDFADFVDVVKVELARLVAKDLISGIAGAFGGGSAAGGGGIIGSLVGGIVTWIGGFFAGGGPVTGPGGPKDDNILAMVSSGEYVINAAAAKKLGPARLSLMNQGMIPSFAEGGGVAANTEGIGDTGSGPQVSGPGSIGNSGGVANDIGTLGLALNELIDPAASPTGIGFHSLAEMMVPSTSGSFIGQGVNSIVQTMLAKIGIGQGQTGVQGLTDAQINAIAAATGDQSAIAMNAEQQLGFIGPLIGMGGIGAIAMFGLALANKFGNHGNGELMSEADVAGHADQIERRIPPSTGRLGSFGNFMGPASLKLIEDANSAFASMETGGDRVFTQPTLLSVAENGPEHITGRPLASGGGRGGGVNVIVEGDAVFDDITADDLARKIVERMDNMSFRGIA